MLYSVLAVGDVVGEAGLAHLERHLRPLQKLKNISFTTRNRRPLRSKISQPWPGILPDRLAGRRSHGVSSSIRPISILPKVWLPRVTASAPAS